jgi:hypothetical protein
MCLAHQQLTICWSWAECFIQRHNPTNNHCTILPLTTAPVLFPATQHAHSYTASCQTPTPILPVGVCLTRRRRQLTFCQLWVVMYNTTQPSYRRTLHLLSPTIILSPAQVYDSPPKPPANLQLTFNDWPLACYSCR